MSAKNWTVDPSITRTDDDRPIGAGTNVGVRRRRGLQLLISDVSEVAGDGAVDD